MKYIIFLGFIITSIFAADKISNIETEEITLSDNMVTNKLETSANTDSQNYQNLDPGATIPQSALINQNNISQDAKILEPTFPISNKKPAIAALLSILIPGLGHTYINDYKKAGIIFGSSAVALGGLADSHTKRPGSLTFNTAYYYGIYSAYRDTRVLINDKNFSYKMPTDSFKDLSLAPFKWSVIKKPEVWGGVLGSLALAFTIGYVENKYTFCSSSKLDLNPIYAFPVGLGEEVLFRGFVQSVYAESFTPIGGIFGSSLLFGAAHIPNAQKLDKSERKNYYKFSIPLITSIGGYLGWVTYKNNSLKESVAIHAWYDFVLFSLAAVANEASLFKDTNISFVFSF